MHNIGVLEGNNGTAYRFGRVIRIRPVKSAITYAIALHEIGHILGHGNGLKRLEKEALAWQWAKDNAIEWRKPMKQAMKKRLLSYLRWAIYKNKRGGNAWVPPKQHLAWRLAGKTG